MNALRRHWPRIVITLLPVLLALAHATGAWRLSALDRLDHLIYDARLRATMPGTLDPRIVIVDVDDASLARQGQWPWARDKLARLTKELMGRQQVAVLGFDVMFVEPDRSSGLDKLRQIARGPLRDMPGLAGEIERLAPVLDNDATFARAMEGQRVALGYYFTRTEKPGAKGQLPAAAAVAARGLSAGPRLRHGVERLRRQSARAGCRRARVGFSSTRWSRRATTASFAPCRSSRAMKATSGRPGYYESLGLAVYRLANGTPARAAGLCVGRRRAPAPIADRGRPARAGRRNRQHAGAVSRSGRRETAARSATCRPATCSRAGSRRAS